MRFLDAEATDLVVATWALVLATICVAAVTVYALVRTERSNREGWALQHRLQNRAWRHQEMMRTRFELDRTHLQFSEPFFVLRYPPPDDRDRWESARNSLNALTATMWVLSRKLAGLCIAELADIGRDYSVPPSDTPAQRLLERLNNYTETLSAWHAALIEARYDSSSVATPFLTNELEPKWQALSPSLAEVEAAITPLEYTEILETKRFQWPWRAHLKAEAHGGDKKPMDGESK